MNSERWALPNISARERKHGVGLRYAALVCEERETLGA